MAKFCGKCGSKLDDITGSCQNCGKESKPDSTQLKNESDKDNRFKQNVDDAARADRPKEKLGKKEIKEAKKTERKQAKKDKKKAKRAAMSTGQKIRGFFLKLLLVVLLLAILTAGVVGTLVYFDIVDIPVINNILISTGIKQEEEEPPSNQDDPDDGDETDVEDGMTSSYEVTPPDADEYFQNNSTIVAEIDINASNEVRTEAETYNNFTDRGFAENPITTEYAMDGKYYKATEISRSSSKHPIYQTYYISANGDYWTIIEINGVIMANPLSYNEQSELDVLVIISESSTVTSYDSTTNKFYETIPDKSALIVKTVSRIDAETLDNLTFGGIDAL